MATISTAKKKYMDKMKTAYENDHYAKGMASFFEVKVEDIKDAAPVKNWKAKFDTDEDRKARADKWEANLRSAFGLA